jgi:hypothetical protein
MEFSCVGADTGSGLERSILKVSSITDNYLHMKKAAFLQMIRTEFYQTSN